jgi:hypothetical protein
MKDSILAISFFIVAALELGCGDSFSDKQNANHTDTLADAEQGADTRIALDVTPAVGLDSSPDASAESSTDASVVVLTCDPYMVLCTDHCVDLTTEHDSCGACSLACAQSEVCYLGQCNQACPAGTTECGGGCTDFQSDPHHCGGCPAIEAGSFACETNQVCSRGRCAATCDVTRVLCLGRCIDPMTNPTYCGVSADCSLADGGTSGTTCTQGQVCSGGVCQSACGVGQTRCPDNACRDFKTDSDNCGLCGSECALDKKCVSSVCTCIVPGTCTN